LRSRKITGKSPGEAVPTLGKISCKIRYFLERIALIRKKPCNLAGVHSPGKKGYLCSSFSINQYPGASMTRKKVSEKLGRKKEIFEVKPGKVLSKSFRVALETLLVQERAVLTVVKRY